MRFAGGFIKALCLFAAFTVLLPACGGGGGDGTTAAPSRTLSGTAAAGAPIIGSVTIKDSSLPDAITKTVTIEANGNYTVDVSDLTAPYMVRADGYVGGNEYHLYSAGTAADVGGTINITPLTDLIVANIAGSIAKTYFDSGAFSGLTATDLQTQSEALRDKLLPVLQAIGVSDSIDLLRASFSTDHTGLDAALDILKVSTDPGTQTTTITNIITQQQITSNATTGTYSGTLTDTTGVTAGVSDIQAISAGFQQFSNLFATSVPSDTNLALLALFDSATFMDEGQDLPAFLSNITTDPSMIGLTFANIAIQSIDPATGMAVVTFDVIQQGMVSKDGPMTFHMIKKAGKWYMQGDQTIAHVSIRSQAQYSLNPMNTPIQTGLNINIEDPGAQGITSAIVNGPGLDAPLTLLSQIGYTWFTIEGYQNGNHYMMSDAQINSMPDTGAVYTVDLYNGATKVATYTRTIKKRPYLSSQLSAASFPIITAPTMGQMQAFIGGQITVQWTLPTELTNDWLDAQINGDSGDSARYETSLAPTARSATFTLNPINSTGHPFTITGGGLWLNSHDSYGRQLAITTW